MVRFREKFEMLIWAQKRAIFPILGIGILKYTKYPFKKVTFTHFLMSLVQFQKNLMNRFRQQDENNNFGPKNAPFTPF